MNDGDASLGVPIQGDYIMGRPIQRKWFGPATTPGMQIVVNGVRWADNTTATNAYIVKQTGSNAYIVSNGTKSEIVFMVNANSTPALLPGQCFILATPFGQAPRPCYKIAQYRVDIFDVANTVPRVTGSPVPDPTTSYSWSTIPATGPGQADVITASSIPGAIISITPGLAGFGYFSAPSVSFTGGGVGATATATIANGVVTGYVLGAPGSGYTNGNMTIDAPPAAVTATATATVSGGLVTGITGLTGGGYYAVAPNVTFDAPPAFVTATATITETGGVTDMPSVVLGGGFYDTAPSTSNGGIVIAGASTGSGADYEAVLTNGVITGFTQNNAGTGYDSPVSITIGSPATVNTAPNQTVSTATATVTVAAGTVTGISGLSGGFGYFTAPTATFDAPPAHSTATASATVSV